MPREARNLRIRAGVLVANLGFLLSFRPVGSAVMNGLAIGPRDAYSLLNFTETAPLCLLCLLVSIGPGKSVVRLCGLALGVIGTALASAMYPAFGQPDWPSWSLTERLLAELVLTAVPTCLLIGAFGALGRFRLGPQQLDAQRMTIAGILFSMAALGGTVVWTSNVAKQQFDAIASNTEDRSIDVPIVEIRLRNTKVMCTVGPAVALLILFSAYAGSSLKQSALAALLVMLGLILMRCGRQPLIFAAGPVFVTVWVSLNVAWLRMAEWPCSRRHPVTDCAGA